MDEIQEHFDAHAKSYVSKHTDDHQNRVWNIRKPSFARMVEEQGPGRVDILDAGGGTGFLADLLIDTFPNVHVSVVDISKPLLDLNEPHERKTLVCGDFLKHLAATDTQYGIINFDVILHHVLSIDSYKQSRQMQRDALNASAEALPKGGYISIRELAYSSFGFLPRYACHRLLWTMTTMRMPRVVSNRLHSMGMKSQGGGVCFFHESDLPRMLDELGCEVTDNDLHQFAKIGWRHSLMLSANTMDQYVTARKR